MTERMEIFQKAKHGKHDNKSTCQCFLSENLQTGLHVQTVTNMATPGSCSQDNQTTSIALLEESNQLKKPVDKIKIYIDPTEKQTGKTGL